MFAITGATGQLGRLTITSMIERQPQSRVVALARDPARAANLAASGVEVRAFDYDAPDALADALAGIDRLLLISSDDVARRTDQHRAVIKAATTVGVGFIAYTSVLHADTNPLSVAPSHRATEAMLRDSGIPHAILRNGWYSENYLIGADAAIAQGTLLGSTGTGRISGAARADYAEAAAAVLAAGAAASGVYELAGDEAFTLSDVAAALAEVSGRPVVYCDLSEANYAQALEQGGVPAAFAATLAGFSAGAAGGILADDSRALSRLIGRPTMPLREVVRRALASVAA
ncbi:NAD(P)H-binding protein [Sphingomonas morindae]|uniref:NAD(P)H-binding protein n=1 Tax=Sphingomonas morindae TaxID=1541170 RepID=A0ABY4X6I5_9SPHN|nr:NAD(P)H-binding protein [Sphingomonas morindae]USI72532.1 NAD(P)H-binding protein [Sphingomonas morindae]